MCCCYPRFLHGYLIILSKCELVVWSYERYFFLAFLFRHDKPYNVVVAGVGSGLLFLISQPFQPQPVYQYVNSPYIIPHKVSCFVMRIKQMIIHSNLFEMKNEVLPTFLQGIRLGSSEEFSITSFGVFGVEIKLVSNQHSCRFYFLYILYVKYFFHQLLRRSRTNDRFPLLALPSSLLTEQMFTLYTCENIDDCQLHRRESYERKPPCCIHFL